MRAAGRRGGPGQDDPGRARDRRAACARRRGTRADPGACGPPRAVAGRDRAAVPVPLQRRRRGVRSAARGATMPADVNPWTRAVHGDCLDRLREAAGGARGRRGRAMGRAGGRRGARAAARGPTAEWRRRRSRRARGTCCCSPRRPTRAATRNSLRSAASGRSPATTRATLGHSPDAAGCGARRRRGGCASRGSRSAAPNAGCTRCCASTRARSGASAVRESAAARLAMTVLLKRAASSAWALHCSVRATACACSGGGRGPRPAAACRSTIPARPTPSMRTCRTRSREPGPRRAWARAADCSPQLATPRTPRQPARASWRALRRCCGARANPPSCSPSIATRSTRQLRALGALGPIAVLHGGLSRGDRREAERAFTGGRRACPARHRRRERRAQPARPLPPRDQPRAAMEPGQARTADRPGRSHRPAATRARRPHGGARDTAESYVLERLVARVRNIRRSLGEAYGGVGCDRHDARGGCAR